VQRISGLAAAIFGRLDLRSESLSGGAEGVALRRRRGPFRRRQVRIGAARLPGPVRDGSLVHGTRCGRRRRGRRLGEVVRRATASIARLAARRRVSGSGRRGRLAPDPTSPGGGSLGASPLKMDVVAPLASLSRPHLGHGPFVVRHARDETLFALLETSEAVATERQRLLVVMVIRVRAEVARVVFVIDDDPLGRLLRAGRLHLGRGGLGRRREQPLRHGGRIRPGLDGRRAAAIGARALGRLRARGRFVADGANAKQIRQHGGLVAARLLLDLSFVVRWLRLGRLSDSVAVDVAAAAAVEAAPVHVGTVAAPQRRLERAEHHRHHLVLFDTLTHTYILYIRACAQYVHRTLTEPDSIFFFLFVVSWWPGALLSRFGRDWRMNFLRGGQGSALLVYTHMLKESLSMAHHCLMHHATTGDARVRLRGDISPEKFSHRDEFLSSRSIDRSRFGVNSSQVPGNPRTDVETSKLGEKI
jgi:hypothetical protein